MHPTQKNTKKSVASLKEKLKNKLSAGEDAIFDSHLMILEDMALVHDIENLIKSELKSAEFAVYEASEKYVKVLEELSDPYLRERAADVRDVRSRVLENFHVSEEKALDENIYLNILRTH